MFAERAAYGSSNRPYPMDILVLVPVTGMDGYKALVKYTVHMESISVYFPLFQVSVELKAIKEVHYAV